MAALTAPTQLMAAELPKNKPSFLHSGQQQQHKSGHSGCHHARASVVLVQAAAAAALQQLAN
jgi:hypothetical protein